MLPKDLENEGKPVLIINLITDNMSLDVFQDFSVA
jgi:hypothetical protein